MELFPRDPSCGRLVAATRHHRAEHLIETRALILRSSAARAPTGIAHVGRAGLSQCASNPTGTAQRHGGMVARRGYDREGTCSRSAFGTHAPEGNSLADGLDRMRREAARYECVDTVPANLDTDTQQDECAQAHHNTGACRTQLAKDSIGVAIAEINAESNEQYANRVREGG